MKLNKFLSYLFSFTLILGLLLFNVYIKVNDDNFFIDKYKIYNVYNNFKDNNICVVDSVHKDLFNYLRSGDPIKNTSNNSVDELSLLSTGQCYSEIEILHMVDVKNLYINFCYSFILLTILSVVLLIYHLIKYLKDKNYIYFITYCFKKTLIVTFSIIISLGVYATTSFDSFWTNFHKVFFRNDLWLLPETSTLIKLLPSELFMNLSISIIINYLISLTIVCLVLFLLKKGVKHD